VSIFDRLSKTETRSSAMKKPVYHENFVSTESSASISTCRSQRSNMSRYSSRTSTSRMSTMTAPVSSSLFNRLAYTETYASASMKGKINESPATKRSSNGRSSDSFFNRMANTDTYSTASMKGKMKSSQKSRNVTDDAFFNRMAYTETYATANMKGKVDDTSSVKTSRSHKSTSSRKSRKSVDSFFDRMATSDTFATATMKGKINPKPKQSISPRPRRTLTQKITNISFFDRLSKTETQSSSRRKDTSRPKSASSSNFQSNSSKKRVSSRSSKVSSLPQNFRPRRPFLFRRKSKSNAPDGGSPKNSFTRKSDIRQKKRPVTADGTPKSKPLSQSKQLQARPWTSSLRKNKLKREPQPVLRFESEDDLSFGDEDEEEEILFDGNSLMKAAKQECSQAVKNENEVIEKNNSVSSSQPDSADIVVSDTNTAVPVGDLLSLGLENNPPAKDNNSGPPQTEDLLGIKMKSTLLSQEASLQGLPVPQDNPAMEAEVKDDSFLSFDDSTEIEEEKALDELLGEDELNYDEALPVVMEEEGSIREEMSHDDPLGKEESDQEEKKIVEEPTIADAPKMTKYKLFCSDKYQPEMGMQELDPVSLNLADSLVMFESNAFSREEVSVLLIEALFRRDFKDGDHWEVDPGTARELEEDEGGGGELDGRAFVVKQQARWDSEKSYSVAAAKGTVTIWPENDEIRMENYSYFVAG